MLKYLLIFLLIFLTFSTLSFAKINEASLRKEYGPTLMEVPYYIRFAYRDKYNRDWAETYYSDRKDFLLEYETNEAAEKIKEKAEAKAEAAAEKQRLLDKKQDELKLRNRIKARLAQEKAEKAADAERQKEFKQLIRDQKQEIQDLKQEEAQSRLQT